MLQPHSHLGSQAYKTIYWIQICRGVLPARGINHQQKTEHALSAITSFPPSPYWIIKGAMADAARLLYQQLLRFVRSQQEA
jgi:hypothetical protein